MIEITEEWMMHKTTLGEGTYGEVKLIVNRNTNEKIACKIINYKNDPSIISAVKKEVMIHKILVHENIIKYFGRNRNSDKEFIYLEFAARGELFQMIEPDIGMPSSLAQRYMRQLLNGLDYIHSKGIVHRDIKPENLLVDEASNLKISDFGLATLYRCKGKERLLDKKCGTKPYCAPEVLLRPYRGPPADIWSCGVVLVAMLAGELPWSDTKSIEFKQYIKDVYLTLSPWNKLGNSTLSLIRKILSIDPVKRFKIEDIVNHPWMKFKFEDVELDELDGNTIKRWTSMIEAETHYNSNDPNVILSQPIMRPTAIDQLINNIDNKREQICFSQPVQNENMILSSQIQFTQTPITRDNFNLVKRMMRFFVVTSCEKTLEVLGTVLNNLHYSWHVDAAGSVTITTVDLMKNQLVFKANVLEMDGKILLDFRLAKGCGIEFKKKFIKLKACLKEIIDNN